MGASPDPSSSLPSSQGGQPSRSVLPDRGAFTPGRRPLDYAGSQGWEARISSRTILAATIGAATGLALGICRRQSILTYSATLGANFGVAAASFCGAQELVRELRAADPGDPINCLLGGLASGALLGRLHGGPARVLPTAIIFAVVGTTLQVGAAQIREYRIQKFLDSIPFDANVGNSDVEGRQADDLTNVQKKSAWRLPEWFPIQKLDDEAIKKRALERELRLQNRIGSLRSVEFQADDRRQ